MRVRLADVFDLVDDFLFDLTYSHPGQSVDLSNCLQRVFSMLCSDHHAVIADGMVDPIWTTTTFTIDTGFLVRIVTRNVCQDVQVFISHVLNADYHKSVVKCTCV